MLLSKLSTIKRIPLTFIFFIVLSTIWDILISKEPIREAIWFSLFFALFMTFLSEVMEAYKRDNLKQSQPIE